MNRIYQKNHFDCFNSCLATITGVPKEQIPLFVDNPDRYIQSARKWLAKRGFVLSEVKDVGELDRRLNSVVAVDPYDFQGVFAAHAVVVRHGRVVHDPARRHIKKKYDVVCGWEIRRVKTQ